MVRLTNHSLNRNVLMEPLEQRKLFSQGLDIALLASDLPEMEMLEKSALKADCVILFDTMQDSADEILGQVLDLSAVSGKPINSLSILSHGSAGRFALGNEMITEENYRQTFAGLTEDQSFWDKNASLYICGCNVASSREGKDFIRNIGQTTGLRVSASDDITGYDGDWIFEVAYEAGQLKEEQAQLPIIDLDQIKPYAWNLAANNPPVINETTNNYFWLTTMQNVASHSGVAGLDSWDDAEIIKFGQSGLSVEPGTSAGYFSSLINLDVFANDGDANLDALHYVTTDMTVGNSNSIDLFKGDILLSLESDETMISNNTLHLDRNDVFIFRPNTPGDYSAGDFVLLLDDFNPNKIVAVSLVEKTTSVGDTILQEGSFIFCEDGKKDVLLFTPEDVGEGTTSGTEVMLIDGSDIGATKQFSAIELIETSTDLGGITLPAGTILASTKDTILSFGDNNISVSGNDIFSLTVFTTGKNNTSADAAILIEGVDLGLNTAAEKPAGFSIVQSVIPISFDVTENSSLGTLVGTVIATDPDVGQLLTYAITAGNTNGAFEIDSTTGQIMVNNILDFEDISSYTLNVQVTDDGLGNLTDSAIVTININNLDETLPVDPVGGTIEIIVPLEPVEDISQDQVSYEPVRCPQMDLPLININPTVQVISDSTVLIDPPADTNVNVTVQPEVSVASDKSEQSNSQQSQQSESENSEVTKTEAKQADVAQSNEQNNEKNDRSKSDESNSEAKEKVSARNSESAVQWLSRTSNANKQKSLQAKKIKIKSHKPSRQWRELKKIKNSTDQTIATRQKQVKIVTGTLAGTSLAFSVGYFTWSIKTGTMMAGFLGSIPICGVCDPLAVLNYNDSKRKTKSKNKSESCEKNDSKVNSLFKREQ